MSHLYGCWLVCLCVVAGSSVPLRAADLAVAVQVDFARTEGKIRALNGTNKGPLGPGGLLDLTADHRALGIPYVRLHDCYWPNPYVVDMHAVFPDFNADPGRPENYDFRLTDEYLAAIRATGARIVYRLGESIEHTTVKRFVHPPADNGRWAAICLGIIRHYNKGWAAGFHHDIRYWEIWNEPENRPAMWSGSDEDYFRLYRVAATTIKRAFPGLKVGGPSVGASGSLVADGIQPTPFVLQFLEFCRKESLPLDFFSWHCYTDDPAELAGRARGIRELLDAHGFDRTESHLNEWNYLPGNSWEGMSRDAPAADRRRYFAEMSGAPGAAFIASALIGLQDAPLDMANFYHAEIGPFGIFDEFGVPQKSYFALRAFRELLDTPRRVRVETGISGRLAIAAGLSEDRSSAAILASHLDRDPSELRIELEALPWNADTIAELRLVDASHDFALLRREELKEGNRVILLRFQEPAVALIHLRPADPHEAR